MEAPPLSEGLGARPVDELQAPGGLEQRVELGDEARAVPGVGLARPVPGVATHEEPGLRKEELGLPPLRGLPGGQEAAGVVEVEVREHDDVDVGVADADRKSTRLNSSHSSVSRMPSSA